MGGGDSDPHAGGRQKALSSLRRRAEVEPVVVPPAPDPEPVAVAREAPVRKAPSSYRRPPTEMLNEPQAA